MIQRAITGVFFLTGLLLNPPAVFAQNKDSVSVMKAAERFILAFNHFKWEPFSTSFAEDASIFFPERDAAERISGKANIEKAWLHLFPEFNKNPDNYKLDISPRNVLLQLYGSTAVMTFHLGDGLSRLARRTILWRKHKGTWKIVHLHASVLTKETSTK